MRALPGRLVTYSAGLAGNRRIRRILRLAGTRLTLGWPGANDGVAVWGRGSGVARRGEAVAMRTGVPLYRLEDAFLRSLRPGRTGARTLGLLVDGTGLYYDTDRPGDFTRMLDEAPVPGALLARAREAIGRMQAAHLSKYSATDPGLDPGAEDYVLVIDQTRGDASIRHGGADAATFGVMLAAARTEHPDATILIKTHPETAAGLRRGHFGPADTRDGRSRLLAGPYSPWRLFAGARAVYCVTSLMGFEAILAGHRPEVFGRPFYAGRGLCRDRAGPRGAARPRSAEELFALAYLEAPLWYDPCRDRLCRFEQVLDQIEAEARAWREDRSGYVALGMRRWKRPAMRRFFGRVSFARSTQHALALATRLRAPLLVWAAAEPEGLAEACRTSGVTLRRVEDGFLRSRGLGADLVPPLSLAVEDTGIHFDAHCPSRLEELITAAAGGGLSDPERRRAEALIDRLRRSGLSKYNLGSRPASPLPPGRRILVPGQVADDASIRRGAGLVDDNAALLAAVREANPEAVIVYKPHPDVEAGLRPGAVSRDTLAAFANVVAEGADPVALIAATDEVWTMTSILGFEALLRGRPVTCLGMPFYAGWGLTRDLGPVPRRRSARPDLAELVHAALIAYPRYHDPVSGFPCPVEVVLDRLSQGEVPARSALARLQRRVPGSLRLWR